MTKRGLCLSILAMLLIADVTRVQAGIIDWMQGWSGPGPFNGFATAIDCRDQRRFSVTAPTKPCFYVDLRWLKTDAEDNKFPTPVKVFYTGIGFSKQLHLERINESVSIGIGAALMHIKSDSVLTPDGKQIGGKAINRVTITAPRVTIKPATLITEILTKPSDKITGDANTAFDRARNAANGADAAMQRLREARASLARLEISGELRTQIDGQLNSVADYLQTVKDNLRTPEEARSAVIDRYRVQRLNAFWGGDQDASWERKAGYRIASVFKVYISGNWMFQPLYTSDLGVPQELDPTYKRKNEYILSRGIYFDFAELLPRWYK